jgi:simple sugar transport system ATP-binding protein
MLQLCNIGKRFGAFEALRDVNFEVRSGEVVGLLGENGAGKSTLLNLVGGALQPSSGEMKWDGQPVRFASPRAATRLGIGVVPQHPKLVEVFSAGENLALHANLAGVRLDVAVWNARVQQWAQSLGWQVNADVPVETLSTGERQRIEILKALFSHSADDEGARLLLLDEPTANLTPAEADELFAVVRRLREQGRGIVFVSHKLNEVMALCDRVVVLRRGHIVGERLGSQTNTGELARLMIGDEPVEMSTRRSR